jgi:hypothetical protein
MKRLLLLAFVFALLILFGGCGSSGHGSVAVDHSTSPTGDDDDSANPNDPSGDQAADDDLCAPVAPPAWPEPDLSDPSTISYDDQLFFTVNGQRFYPLGFYNAPSDDAGLADYKSQGFNIALTGPGCCDGTSLQDQIDLIHRGQSAGVMMILHPWSPIEQVLSRPDDELAAELAPRDAVGGLFGWYTFDEPGLANVPLSETDRVHQVLHDYDPTHPDGLVEQTMIPFTHYMADCAMFMIDPYPIDWMPMSYFKVTIQQALEAAQYAKPIVGVPQAFSWDWINGNESAPFHPDATEVRNMIWQYIIFGASGMVAWNYDGDYTIHEQPDIWAAYLQDIAEIHALMSVILSDNVAIDFAAQCAFPETFDYIVKQDETATWIFSVSTNSHGQDVTFDLTPLGKGRCIVDYTTGEIFGQDDASKVAVHYTGYQVRILEVK